jgi:AbrB family looped-hinge helix DNA binding protein
MTSKVGPKGQVVLPKRVRDELGIRPGDEVVVEAVNGEAHLRRVPRGESGRGMLRGSGLLADLEAEHRRELEAEENKIAAYGRRLDDV